MYGKQKINIGKKLTARRKMKLKNLKSNLCRKLKDKKKMDKFRQLKNDYKRFPYFFCLSAI